MAGKNKQKRARDGRFEHQERDWDMARDWYVAGEITDEGPDGMIRRRRVVYKDIAERFNVTVQAVGHHARKGNWSELREKFDEGRAEEIARGYGRVAAMSLQEAASLIDDWLTQFKQELVEGKVATRNVGDLDKALRCKVFMESELAKPRARQDIEQQFSLADLQRRHAAAMRDEEDDEDGLLSGYVRPAVGNDDEDDEEEVDETLASSM